MDPTTSPAAAACGCDEDRRLGLSRRRLLTAAAAGVAGAGVSVFGEAIRQTSFASTTGGNVLVVLSLRGGIDGLGAVVPHGDPAYQRARPSIAIPTGSLLAKDTMFGLHPSLAALAPLWRDGRVAAVHAVGLPVPNRSHFAAMEEIEDADPTSSVRQGWVNRMVGLDDTRSPLEGIHLGQSYAPTMLTGPQPTLAAGKLDRLALPGDDMPADVMAARMDSLRTIWGSAPGQLGTAARSALVVASRLKKLVHTEYAPAHGARYPDNWIGADVGKALADTANLIKADVGADVISVDFGNFDLHADYGTTTNGRMALLLEALGDGIAAFFTDLGTTADRVTLLTISEFGRRVDENGNRGLDHGWGNMMLVAGAGVRGGRYYGTWPGLALDDLVDGDLQVTTDYRDVIGEVVGARFPSRSLAQVFPGHVMNPLGLMRAA